MNLIIWTPKGYKGLFKTQLNRKDLKENIPTNYSLFWALTREWSHGQDINEFLFQYFNSSRFSGFVGLKLYPSLGFYPFSSSFGACYRLPIDHQLPISTHCTPDGACWSDKTLPQHLQISLSFNPVGATTPIDPGIRSKCINLKNDIQRNYHLKPMDFCDYFLHPLNYWDVLLKYPELKLCLAHTGGEGTIKGKEERVIAREWYKDIKELFCKL
ncbi:MAG: hypothetical protein IPH28_24600 [Cytophagaceae bacterium]|nr:hypothetical protein [Cytophagaceae bacterium]